MKSPVVKSPFTGRVTVESPVLATSTVCGLLVVVAV